MKKLTWWLRMVGGFYLLLTLMNLYGLFIHPDFYSQILPFKADELTTATRAFADAWLVFVFELGVLGAMALYASRTPEKSGLLVLTLVWAEVFRGVLADALWIARGYSASSYLPFILLHLIIIVTGVLFLRQEATRTSVPART